MSLLLDTNVLSELRKGQRAHPNVQAWFRSVDESDLFTSVLVLGEIRRGIESVRNREPTAAQAVQQWLWRMTELFDDRILPIDAAVADQWGVLNVPDPVPTVDGLLAATALVRGFTLVTRNVKDVRRTGVQVLNPFDA